MYSLYYRFISELVRHNYSEKDTIRICQYLQPFFQYLVNVHQVTSLDTLKRELVKAYMEMLLDRSMPRYRTIYAEEGGKAYVAAACLFCRQMFKLGLIPEDYGSFPKSKHQPYSAQKESSAHGRVQETAAMENRICSRQRSATVDRELVVAQ